MPRALIRDDAVDSGRRRPVAAIVRVGLSGGDSAVGEQAVEHFGELARGRALREALAEIGGRFAESAPFNFRRARNRK